MWRYENSKFLIFASKISAKSETLAIKNVIPTAKKTGYFWILVFGLELGISGILAYKFTLVLFNEKNNRAWMKSETQFLRKKQYDLHVFQTFVRCEINLGIGSIIM